MFYSHKKKDEKHENIKELPDSSNIQIYKRTHHLSYVHTHVTVMLTPSHRWQTVDSSSSDGTGGLFMQVSVKELGLWC